MLLTSRTSLTSTTCRPGASHSTTGARRNPKKSPPHTGRPPTRISSAPSTHSSTDRGASSSLPPALSSPRAHACHCALAQPYVPRSTAQSTCSKATWSRAVALWLAVLALAATVDQPASPFGTSELGTVSGRPGARAEKPPW
jgi:hypothetical protein